MSIPLLVKSTSKPAEELGEFPEGLIPTPCALTEELGQMESQIKKLAIIPIETIAFNTFLLVVIIFNY
jgi:hypothetical protein